LPGGGRKGPRGSRTGSRPRSICGKSASSGSAVSANLSEHVYLQHIFVERPRGFEPRTYALRAQDDEDHMWENYCVPTVSESPWSAVSPLAPTCSALIPGYDSTLAGFRGSAATGHGDLRISHLDLRTRQWVGRLSLRCPSTRPARQRPGLRCVPRLVSSRANVAGRPDRAPWTCHNVSISVTLLA